MKLRITTRVTPVEYWDCLSDIPLFNWEQCTEDKYLFIRKSVNNKIEENEQDFIAWRKVYDEYLIKFGLSKKYLKLLELIKKKALLEAKFVESGDYFNITKIKIEEENLRMMLNNKGVDMTINQTLIVLSKWMGGNIINKKSITAEQYFELLEQYGKSN